MAHDGPDKPPKAPGDVYRPDTEKDEAYDRQHGERSDARSVHTMASAHSTIADHQDVENANEILRRTYTPKNPIELVPRSKRRGLFARFALVAEITNPYDYSNNLKWFITFIVSVAGAAAPVGSAILLRKKHINIGRRKYNANMLDSGTDAGGAGPRRNASHHQHGGSTVYVVHGHLPALVVGIFRDPWSPDHLPDFLCPLCRLFRAQCCFAHHHHAHRYATPCWRGRSVRASSWRRHDI